MPLVSDRSFPLQPLSVAQTEIPCAKKDIMLFFSLSYDLFIYDLNIIIIIHLEGNKLKDIRETSVI